MSKKTLNRVMLIGNLVRKPELRTTSQGVSVATFHVITEREWNHNGERKSESTRHVCVAWDRLAEICADLLDKGTLVYIDGRLDNRKFMDVSGVEKEQTEIIVDEMIRLKDGYNQEQYGERYPTTNSSD